MKTDTSYATEMRNNSRWGGIPAAAVMMLLIGVPAVSQEFDQTPITVTFLGAGQVEARVAFDVDSLLADRPFRELTEKDYEALRAMPPDQRRKRLDEIREYLRPRVILKFEGKPIETEVSFPNCEGENALGDLPGKEFVVRGAIPEEAQSFTFTASPIFFNVFLLIRVEGTKTGLREVLPPGGESSPFESFRSKTDD